MKKMRNNKGVYVSAGMACLVLCIAIMMGFIGRGQVLIGRQGNEPATQRSLLAGGSLSRLPVMRIAQIHLTKSSSVQEKRSPRRTRTHYYHSSTHSSSHGPMEPWEWFLLIGIIAVAIIVWLVKRATSGGGDDDYSDSTYSGRNESNEYYTVRDSNAGNRGRIWNND